MTDKLTAMRVEDLACNGFKVGEELSVAERLEVVEYTLHFEECSDSREQLGGMTDKDLIETAYRAMAAYSSGQI